PSPTRKYRSPRRRAEVPSRVGASLPHGHSSRAQARDAIGGDRGVHDDPIALGLERPDTTDTQRLAVGAEDADQQARDDVRQWLTPSLPPRPPRPPHRHPPPPPPP